MPTYRPPYVGLQYSEALADAYVHTPSDDPVLVTLELHHDDWAEPVRVVNDWEPLDATLEADAPTDPSTEVEFAGIPFTFSRPAETDSGAPAAVTISVDNLSTIVTQMIMEVQESEEPIQVYIRTYLRTDTGAPHELPVLKMWVQSPVQIDSSTARLTCSFGDLTNRRFPKLLWRRANIVLPSVTWSPTYKGTTIILSGANLIATDPSDSVSTYATVRATASFTTGKWYWEVEVLRLDEVLDLFIGLIHTGADWDQRMVATPDNYPRYAYRSTGDRYDASVTSAYSALAASDVVGIAYDADADKIWYRLNGAWLNSGDPAAGTNASSSGIVTSEAMTPAVGFDNNPGTAAVRGRFLAASWSDAAPTGFLPIPVPA